MEPIAKAAQAVVQRASKPRTVRDQTPAEATCSDRVERLWKRMQRVYGAKWASQYGDTDDGTWTTALAEFSEAEVFAGIQACIDSGDEWPPSLPQFRALCRPAPRENAAMYRLPPERQLPHLLTDEARASGRANIAKLRASLTDGDAA